MKFVKASLALSAVVGCIAVSYGGFGDFLKKATDVVSTADQVVNGPSPETVAAQSTESAQNQTASRVQSVLSAANPPAVADTAVAGTVNDIQMSELAQLRNANPATVIIDVRTSGEFGSGHIPGAKNIPVDKIGKKIRSVVPNLDTPIYLYCLSGARAGTAGEALVALGYKKVYNAGSVSNWPGGLK